MLSKSILLLTRFEQPIKGGSGDVEGLSRTLLKLARRKAVLPEAIDQIFD